MTVSSPMKLALAPEARHNACKLFAAVQGRHNMTEHEVECAVEELLAQCVQHAGDPTSSLGYALSRAFGPAGTR